MRGAVANDRLDETVAIPLFGPRAFREDVAKTRHDCLACGRRLRGRYCRSCRAFVVDDYGDWLAPDPKDVA
jgi:hypothetical protein